MLLTQRGNTACHDANQQSLNFFLLLHILREITASYKYHSWLTLYNLYIANDVVFYVDIVTFLWLTCRMISYVSGVMCPILPLGRQYSVDLWTSGHSWKTFCDICHDRFIDTLYSTQSRHNANSVECSSLWHCVYCVVFLCCCIISKLPRLD